MRGSTPREGVRRGPYHVVRAALSDKFEVYGVKAFFDSYRKGLLLPPIYVTPDFREAQAQRDKANEAEEEA